MPGTFNSILLHIIFSTKRREPLIAEEVRDRLYDYIGGTVRGEGGVLYEIGGMPDHVHLFVRWRTDGRVSDLVRDVKAGSSRWMHECYPRRPFAWQEGYAVFSVSRSGADDVTKYIRNQEAHHKTMTFEEEFLAFLRRHDVEFDPRYVFD